MLFRFGADGMVASIHADARGGMVGKTVTRMPWECRVSDCRLQDGMQVPFAGEVVWHTPQGEKSYYRALLGR